MDEPEEEVAGDGVLGGGGAVEEVGGICESASKVRGISSLVCRVIGSKTRGVGSVMIDLDNSSGASSNTSECCEDLREIGLEDRE